jgi:hypothetical protein
MPSPFHTRKQNSGRALPQARLAFNVDAAAIAIALIFAVLIRFNVIHRIGW